MTRPFSNAELSSPPLHVAIIMDGNGRWAAERGLPRGEGHRHGVEAVRRTVQAAIELKIGYLTLYSFSKENWSRPEPEIRDLMGLLKRFIRRDLADLHENNVRIRVIGEPNRVEKGVLRLIDEAVVLTKANTGLQLTIAFNYGARDEIARTARSLAEQVKSGALDPDEITAECFAANLDTAGLPDPDLLIRTSGEMRLSNFLLWQCAYTELVFMDIFWPDFSEQYLLEAIAQFHDRERRFGGLQARTSA